MRFEEEEESGPFEATWKGLLADAERIAEAVIPAAYISDDCPQYGIARRLLTCLLVYNRVLSLSGMDLPLARLLANLKENPGSVLIRAGLTRSLPSPVGDYAEDSLVLYDASEEDYREEILDALADLL